MTDDAARAVRVRIQGQVQGVWFRGWTVEQARALGLAGWVRNCSDGSVEALFSGPEPAVQRMLALCHEGPPGARVLTVAMQPAPDAAAVEPGFHQLPTL